MLDGLHTAGMRISIVLKTVSICHDTFDEKMSWSSVVFVLVTGRISKTFSYPNTDNPKKRIAFSDKSARGQMNHISNA